MKILHCDCCHAEVNDYSHWYNDAHPRNMYELKCVHESGSDTYNGMIICHECIAKLLHKIEGSSADEEIDIIKRYDEKQNCIERCCKNCKHSENGMIGNKKRCEVCYYDGVLKGNTLFESMETDSKIEVGDVCRYQTCKRIFIITSIHEGFGGEEYFDAIYSNGEAIKNGKLSVIEKINGECVDKLENIFSALINICISGKADA